jgi:hypothetical protein
MEHLLNYFQREIILHNEKRELNEEHKTKIRFLYFLAVLFIILLCGSFFNIL